MKYKGKEYRLVKGRTNKPCSKCVFDNDLENCFEVNCTPKGIASKAYYKEVKPKAKKK